jgi:hypothetical protein
MTYNVLVTETRTCQLTFDTKEDALAVSERINRTDELKDSEFNEHIEWMYSILPDWEVETIAEVTGIDKQHWDDLYARLHDAYTECLKNHNSTYEQKLAQVLDHMIENKKYLYIR